MSRSQMGSCKSLIDLSQFCEKKMKSHIRNFARRIGCLFAEAVSEEGVGPTFCQFTITPEDA